MASLPKYNDIILEMYLYHYRNMTSFSKYYFDIIFQNITNIITLLLRTNFYFLTVALKCHCLTHSVRMCYFRIDFLQDRIKFNTALIQIFINTDTPTLLLQLTDKFKQGNGQSLLGQTLIQDWERLALISSILCVHIFISSFLGAVYIMSCWQYILLLLQKPCSSLNCYNQTK